jgi:hypothetical protein
MPAETRTLLAPVPCIPPRATAGGAAALAWNLLWSTDPARPPALHTAHADGTLATHVLPHVSPSPSPSRTS